MILKTKLIIILLVALGGAVGAVIRYLVGMAIARLAPYAFPFGTLTINIIGSFLIGVLFFAFQGSPKEEILRALVIVGVLGGFTTFSAFSLETIGLMTNGRYLAALAYICGSVFLSLSACMIGMRLMRV